MFKVPKRSETEPQAAYELNELDGSSYDGSSDPYDEKMGSLKRNDLECNHAPTTESERPSNTVDPSRSTASDTDGGDHATSHRRKVHVPAIKALGHKNTDRSKYM